MFFQEKIALKAVYFKVNIAYKVYNIGYILQKSEQSIYGKMFLFQNIPVTHLGQNRLEYSEFDAWKPDTTAIVHAVHKEYPQ